MNDLLDAGWRAAAYCLHPRMIWLSVLPLLLAAVLTVGLGYFYWEGAVEGVRATLEHWALLRAALDMLDSIGAPGLRLVLAPLIVVALAVPVIVVISLVLVAVTMTPSIVNLVAARRFPALERRRGASVWASMLWSLGFTLLALLALIITLPLWLVPPLVLVLPPLIWGWLAYRVMSFDVLAAHASAAERRQLLREHRWPLLAIGVVSGYLSAAPSLLWAMGAATLVFAPLLVVFSLWLYTIVFAFAALWFAHYALAALAALRHRPVADDLLSGGPAALPPSRRSPADAEDAPSPGLGPRMPSAQPPGPAG
jgi:hypothetical protein